MFHLVFDLAPNGVEPLSPLAGRVKEAKTQPQGEKRAGAYGGSAADNIAQIPQLTGLAQEPRRLPQQIASMGARKQNLKKMGTVPMQGSFSATMAPADAQQQLLAMAKPKPPVAPAGTGRRTRCEARRGAIPTPGAARSQGRFGLPQRHLCGQGWQGR